MDDEKIIELFWERSEQAISETADKYGGICRKIAWNILGNEEDTQECVNDTYLGAWNSIPPRRPGALRAYLCRIARNQAVKKYRLNTAAKRTCELTCVLEELEDCIPAPSSWEVEDQIEARELAEDLEEFLDTLKERDRLVFLRRYWFAQPVKSISRECGVTEHHAAVILERSRKKLKCFLEERGVRI